MLHCESAKIAECEVTRDASVGLLINRLQAELHEPLAWFNDRKFSIGAGVFHFKEDEYTKFMCTADVTNALNSKPDTEPLHCWITRIPQRDEQFTEDV